MVFPEFPDEDYICVPVKGIIGYSELDFGRGRVIIILYCNKNLYK